MCPSLEISEICEQLSGTPTSPRKAKPELPRRPGFYAWWVRPNALPTVPPTPHPREEWLLLYVGIAPGRASSSATIYSRVGGQHIGGNTGSSTFRLSLASLLFEEMSWQPFCRGKKVTLSSEDNKALRVWQEDHGGLCWVSSDEPWAGSTERAVIAQMGPPLNLAENVGHPFHAAMSAARRHFRASAIEI
jgi:hypothetical protein